MLKEEMNVYFIPGHKYVVSNTKYKKKYGHKGDYLRRLAGRILTVDCEQMTYITAEGYRISRVWCTEVGVANARY